MPAGALILMSGVGLTPGAITTWPNDGSGPDGTGTGTAATDADGAHVLFNGTSNTFQFSGISDLSRDWTFYTVFKRSATTANRRLFDTATGRLIISDANSGVEAIFDGTYRNYGPAVSTSLQGITRVLNDAGATHEYYAGRTAGGTPSAYTGRAMGGNTHLGSTNGASNFFPGRVYFFAAYPTVHDAATRTQAWDFLATLYGGIY